MHWPKTTNTMLVFPQVSIAPTSIENSSGVIRNRGDRGIYLLRPYRRASMQGPAPGRIDLPITVDGVRPVDLCLLSPPPFSPQRGDRYHCSGG
jgi:hypothetical protein